MLTKDDLRRSFQEKERRIGILKEECERIKEQLRKASTKKMICDRCGSQEFNVFSDGHGYFVKCAKVGCGAKLRGGLYFKQTDRS